MNRSLAPITTRSILVPAVLLAAASLLLAPAAHAQEASFEGLGDLPGGAFSSSAGGVSADGSTVVGQSTSASGNEAFRWTASGGMVGLSDLPGGTFNSNARDVSADGNVVVGAGTSANGNEAFRWTQAGGMLGLGDLPGGGIGQSRALGVSADGSVVVGGSGSANGNEAFRWTQAGGMQGLGDLPGGDISSEALAVSSDGSVVVGFGTNASDFEAFIWTAASGMQGLGDLPGGVDQSFAFGVSSDGSVVAGVGKSANGDEAFRWTAAGGMVGLGFLPGGFVSDAFGVSADGSVVVGDAQNAAFDLEAFVWTATDGMRSLRDVLVAQGVDMTGWTLPTTNAVSADGRTVVSFGTNPQGQQEAWRAVLAGGHRWISPAGGSWDVAVNWSPATVPTEDDDVTFDLDATYTVTGTVPLGGTADARGGRRARRLAADDGLVDYDLADLTLTATTLDNPSLSVSFGARAKLISGTASAFDAIVGYGASTDSTVVARLQVFNAGTTLDASGDLVVGLEGRGEVFVAAGHLNALNTSIGGDFDLPGTADGVGEVIVGNEGTLDTSGLSVGLDAAGTLTVEEGGAVTAQKVVVGGEANVAGLVDVAGVAPSGARSRLFVTDTLFVNEAGGGELAVRDGGEVTATGVLVGGFDGSGFGFLTVSGVEAGERAALTANRLVVGEGNDGALLVEDGGQVLVNDAVLGTAAGSALATVFGTAGGFRAELVATKTGFAGRCLIGDSDTSVLNIHTGGYVRCDQAEIGDTGSGLVEVGGTQTSDSLVVSRVLTIGDGAPGVLRLSPGAVVDGLDAPRNPPSDPADVVVEADGRIEGSGIVVGRVDNDGFIGPGVVVVPPAPLAESPAGRGGGPSVGGTLLVEGAYEQQAGGVLEIPLAGPDTTQQGHLRVRPFPGESALDGSAALGGMLRLAFQNGYAPLTGDTFELLGATSATGTFAATEVTGLEPGWQFEVDIENGAVVLTSLSDGVATTFPIPTEPGAPEAPSAFALGSPYPNPFNPTTVVPYEVPEAGRVRLAVYDMLGREVAVLFDGERGPGRHEAVLDGSRLASGIYVVRMRTEGGFAQTKRVTLLR